ncbi:MAG: hypothetical protein J0L84_04790 [Verrucomicrobia bacterium]|nr:hypothetical protein [Verrucomicrobiota bacterium]
MRRGLGILCSLLGCGMAWSAAPSPPVVRMLVPGFSVQELPVRLSNQNNLRFAPDGSLTSLGYDGRIWRLRDTDGDGLEDRAEPFWDQPTLSVPLGMAWSAGGLYVASKGKVSLIRDADGDGRGDREDIVTSGWPATDVGSGGVDATAVTLDPEGNVFFGLLVADYSNAYRIRKRADLTAADITWLQQEGRWREPEGGASAQDEFSLYDLRSPRGTIQRWDPRTRRRETVATGLRVPVALAFNRFGDLFNTDQEGETWMPEGNPLDELNHIVAGRNYGFPPRHPQWLPDLVSTPPVVGFGLISVLYRGEYDRIFLGFKPTLSVSGITRTNRFGVQFGVHTSFEWLRWNGVFPCVIASLPVEIRRRIATRAQNAVAHLPRRNSRLHSDSESPTCPSIEAELEQSVDPGAGLLAALHHALFLGSRRHRLRRMLQRGMRGTRCGGRTLHRVFRRLRDLCGG